MESRPDAPDDNKRPKGFSGETISRIAAEAGVPEEIVSNLTEADEGERLAEEIRDMILDMLQERGETSLASQADVHLGDKEPDISPGDALKKLEWLRSNLILEPEFEARYPEAYKELFTPPLKEWRAGFQKLAGCPYPRLEFVYSIAHPKVQLEARAVNVRRMPSLRLLSTIEIRVGKSHPHRALCRYKRVTCGAFSLRSWAGRNSGRG